MAKVIVRNMREHDIDLSATLKNGMSERVTIPAGKYNVDAKAIEPGEMAVDEEFLSAVQKTQAVRGMFSDGWLATKTRVAPPSPTTQTGDAAAAASAAAQSGAGK